MKSHLFAAATCLLLSAAPTTGHAYDTFARWSGASQGIRASEVSFAPGSSARASLATAVSRWNNNPSRFNWTVLWDEPAVSLSNLQNEVWFEAGTDSDPPATTFTTVLAGRIILSDIVFYRDSPNVAEGGWTTSTQCSAHVAYGGTRRFFENAAIHELGHALGLDHEDDEYNIMGDDSSHIHRNGSVCHSYVGEDAADGAVALYGADDDARPDLSVTHWKHTGSDDGYSTHGLTRIYASGTDTLKPYTVLGDGQRRYTVAAGETVDVEFTYENNGRGTQEARVGFYRSTDSTISTADTFISSRSFTLARGNVYTVRRPVRIPLNTAPGTFYLGAIIDDEGSLAEFDESNNAASIPIRVN